MERLEHRTDGWALGYRMVAGPYRDEAQETYHATRCRLRGAALATFDAAVSAGEAAAERGD